MFFDAVIAYSLRNKLVISMLVLLLVAWGVRSFWLLPIDAVPDITNNQVQVITQSPALAANEVELQVTSPIEQSLANLPNVVEVRSISRFGLSVITVVFTEEADVLECRQLVTEQLKMAQEVLPPQAGQPDLAPISTGLGEIYQYTISPKRGYEGIYSTTELRSVQDWLVKRRLAGIPGVIEINSFGGKVKEYEVAVDPQKLLALDLSLQDVYTALQANNANTGGSYIEKDQNVYYIRTDGMVRTLDEVRGIIITQKAGIPIRMQDVGTVKFGSSARFGAMTMNGQGEVVGGIVMMLKGANSADVIEKVKERVADIQKSLPKGLEIKPFLDRTKLVNAAIGTVRNNLLEGGLIVIFVLVLLLGNLRAGLVVASVIPLSLLFAIGMMQATGISANLMSLGAIDFGLVVDGAVIIVESIYHHLVIKQRLQPQRLSQDQMDDVVYHSASKIRNSASFGEIIILMVYLPILALVGVEGKMFKPMAQTVGFAIIGALLLSLTWVPVASALFLPKAMSLKATLADKIMGRLEKLYLPVLKWSLRRGAVVLMAAVGLMVVSVWALMQLGGEFVPQLDEGDFAVETRLAPGSSLSQTIEVSTKAEKLLLKAPEVDKVVSKIGTSEIPTDPMPLEANDLIVVLKPRDQWPEPSKTKDELADELAERLEVIPGVGFEFQQPIQMRFNELMTGIKSDVAVKIYGDSLPKLYGLAQHLGQMIEQVPGVASVKVEALGALPQLQVSYKREKLAQYGLTVQDMNMQVQAAFAGLPAGLVYEAERRYNLVVRLDSAYRKEPSQLAQLPIALPNGGSIPLEQVAEVGMVPAPVQVSRDNARRRIVIGLSVRGRDVASVVHDVQALAKAKLKLPTGYYLTYGGQFQNYEEAKARLAVAVPVALLLIFILLYLTFHSVGQSLLIYSAIPLSAIGGIWALHLRDMPFSISAGVGFIALFGVAVLNGIVLIGYFNQLEKEGHTRINRVLRGAVVRLRPVMLTAAVASLGFLPMALSTSSGAEVQKPLATVVIGGLVTSTLLTLLVLPVLYLLWSRGSKASRTTIIAPLVVLMLFMGTGVMAQPKTNAVPSIKLEEALSRLNAANLSQQAAGLQISAAQRLEGTALDLGRTSLDLQYGRTQVAGLNDYGLLINQNVPWPGVYGAQQQALKQQTSAATARKAITLAQLKQLVRNLYCQYEASARREALLQRQDSAWVRVVRVAQARKKEGESIGLEVISAQARLREVQLAMQQESVLRQNLKHELTWLLNMTDQNWQPETNNLLGAKELWKPDTALVNAHPELKELEARTLSARATAKVEQQRRMPDLKLGYANQSIEGIGGQQFGSVGMGINLWSRPQRRRADAAKLQADVLTLEKTLAKQRLQKEWMQSLNEVLRLENSLQVLRSTSLVEAEQLLRVATANYVAGNIDYTEWLTLVRQGWQTQLDVVNLSLNYQLEQNKLRYLLEP